MTGSVGEVVNAYVRAWRAGDVPAIFACYHDDFTIHYAGTSPLAGSHRGKTAALAVMAEVSRKIRRQLVEIVDVMAGTDRAAVLARERFSRDGREALVERLLVYTSKDGLLHECWLYEADQALADSFLG